MESSESLPLRRYGAGLETVVKHVAISGSVPAEHWDARVATKMVELGLPWVFLPHSGSAPLIIENLPGLGQIADRLPAAFDSPVVEPVNLLPGEWFDHYGKRLRYRLREFPDTYEYSTQRMARQLFPICQRLAVWAGRRSGATESQMEALPLDLYAHTLRGMVIGVTDLACHGLGFIEGVPKAPAARALRHLRKNGPMTKVDLMRGAHLTKAERDKLLECFVAADLVRVSGKVVTASTYEEFVCGLYSRKEFPVPENHLEKIAAGAVASPS